MKVTILCVRPRMKFPWVAWLIMFFQKMMPWNLFSFSHMAVLYSTCSGRPRVLDATGKHGVSSRIAKRFNGEYKIVKSYTIEICAEYDCFVNWSEEQEMKHYDFEGLTGLALKMLGIVRNNPLGHNWRKMTCNEVVLSLIKRFYGKDIGDSDNYDLIMTEELVKSIHDEQLEAKC